MSLLSLIIALALVGLVLYLVKLIPMDATVRKIITVVVIVFVVLWLVTNSGLFGPLDRIRIGQ